MDLRRELLTAEMIDPGTGEPVRAAIEVRFDPLTGHSSRILPNRGLMPPSDFDLQGLASQTQPSCPFCPERIDRLTPKLPPGIHPEGRIVRGEAVLFPNLHAYSSHSAVSVYSPRLHYLPVGGLTQRLLADNLAAQVAYAQAVMAAEPQSRWASINANHMLPSGSSLFHPHMQGIVDSQPTTSSGCWPTCRRSGSTAIWTPSGAPGSGTSATPGASAGSPALPRSPRRSCGRSSRASAHPRSSPVSSPTNLAHGLALALGGYAEMGFESFNLAIYGAPPGTEGYPLNLRLACRSNLKELYRSDSTFLERLHWEGAVDLAPETVARQLGDRFRTC